MGTAALLTALHPPSVFLSFVLPSAIAQMLELNCLVTVRQCGHRALGFSYHVFKAPDWTRQNTSRLPDPSLDFHRAALEMAHVREFRVHPWTLIQILVHYLPLLKCLHWLHHSTLVFLLFFPPLYIGTTIWFLFGQISSPSYGFRKTQI